MAPNHYIPSMNRLIVIQLWVVHAGNNIVVVDVGNERGMARMNKLNGLVLPLARGGGRRGAGEGVCIVHTHLRCITGWNTRLVDGR